MICLKSRISTVVINKLQEMAALKAPRPMQPSTHEFMPPEDGGANWARVPFAGIE